MSIIYIILGLFTLGVVYWAIRITKAIIININYKYLAKLSMLVLFIGMIINGLDYLITS